MLHDHNPDSLSTAGRLLRRFLIRSGCPAIRISLWNGESVCVSDTPPVANITVHDLPTLLKMAILPELYFGEGYAQGRIDVEGDLVQTLETVYRSLQQPNARPTRYSRIAAAISRRRHLNTKRGSRQNIHHHYDIGTDFYRLWLDPQLLYTCAYYPLPDDGLDDAQVAKMDYVCRKVRLQPGEKVVEAGCGWGALALHMARNYGVTVRAYNISHEQIVYARGQARGLGLEDRVEFIEDDYRNITGNYDVFMSVGMLEHVGPENYRELGRVIARCLGRAGRGFLHTIGREAPRVLNPWIRKRIFPGAQPPSLSQMMDILEPFGFSVLDVENLRLHYARTLEHWLEKFERSARKIAGMFDEKFVRAWRLYLAGSAVAFRTGTLQLFQVSFAHATNNRIPWTRGHLYAGNAKTGEKQKWMHAMS